MIKAIILDIDNTLYDYESCNKAGMEAVYAAVNKIKNISKEEFLQGYSKAKNIIKQRTDNTAASHNRMLYVQKLCEILEISPLKYALNLYDEFWNAYLDEMKLFDGVYEFFQIMREKNVKLGFCTDLTAHIQFRKLLQLGLEESDAYIVTSEECGIEKPDKAMFEILLEKMKVLPTETVVIGDSWEKDICGANSLGIKGIWFHRKEETDKSMNYIICDNFNEVLENVVKLIQTDSKMGG